MDGEQKFIVLIVSFALICLSVLGIILLVVLGQYGIWVAFSLVGVTELVLLVATGIGVMRSFNEIQLRRERVHRDEYPLDKEGQPYYIPKDAQVYPRQSHYPYSAYNTSPYQEQERGYYGNQ
jgi:hypothetical protein